MRKAQISAQIFVYILGAVIVGVILLVGYHAISVLLTTGRRLDINSFKTDFENAVAQYAREYGSVKKQDFTLPLDFDEICFADSQENGAFPANLKSNALLNSYPIIKNKITNDVQENVFFLKKNVPQNTEPMYVENLAVQNDFLCVPNQGLITVWLKGTGKKALLYIQNE